MTIRTNKYSFFFILFIILTAINCKSYKEQQDELPDTSYRGSINVSADETFKPIVDEFVQVYQSNNRGTNINVKYKPEAECLKDLLNDSIRLIIVTRKYSEEEKQIIIDSLNVGPRSMVVARDGIAVIVHPSSEDTIFTMKDIKNILTGDFKKNLIPVFDGVKATSTVRFIID